MTNRLRKLALTAHVTFSVGWLGAVVAYLALAITALAADDVQLARGAYLAMEVIGWFVIVPGSLAALSTGLVLSFGTEWGLVRHHWILTKAVLTIPATIVLIAHMPAVSSMSEAAASPTFTGANGKLPVQLVIHAAGGLVVLIAATTLSIYRPWGRTRFGRARRADG